MSAARVPISVARPERGLESAGDRAARAGPGGDHRAPDAQALLPGVPGMADAAGGPAGAEPAGGALDEPVGLVAGAPAPAVGADPGGAADALGATPVRGRD